MRSIFSRILIWAIGTTVLSLIGFALTTRLIWDIGPGRIDLIGRIHVLLVEDARAAYDEGGPDRLGRYLKRLDNLFEAEHFLLDSAGRDRVDGSDRSALLGEASTPPAPPRNLGGRLIISSAASGGSRLLIVIRPRFSPAGLLPYYLWIFALIAAMGYALTIYLGRPLFSLRGAVERFGRGDLTSRTGSTRRDEFGDLARAFDLMAGRIEGLVTAQRRLLQDISHELRSPLARLRLTVRLARTSGDREASLDRIKKEADRLSALVDELLQVTAAEEGPHALDREEVRLDDLLRTLVDEGAMEAEARGCRLDLDADRPASALGDRELLRRAFENVLRNATRHAPPGTTVEIKLDTDRETSTITVRDRGDGVPDGALASIFEPFYRVGGHRSRDDGGVGLGLSITKRAIALHGGVISARNAQPGLTVAIELPTAVPRSEGGGIALGI